jgi:hypothetical protein
MSVSLTMIPIVLALRIVMGKNQFEKWVESMERAIPTVFVNESDLVDTLIQAGYDAEKYGGLIKTHHLNKKDYFFWEFRQGKWHAIFSKQDSQDIAAQFMNDLERKLKRKIFNRERESVVEQIEEPRVFPTNFRDRSLLVRTLQDFGVNTIQTNNGDIVCMVQNVQLTFRQEGDAPFHVEIVNAPSLQEIYYYLSDLDDEYKKHVQSQVYEKLKKKIEEKAFTIESEEVLEDNSIVITLNIQQ